MRRRKIYKLNTYLEVSAHGNYLRKYGNIVTFDLNAVPATTVISQTIPDGWRPARNISFPVNTINQNTARCFSGWVYVNTSGVVTGAWFQDGSADNDFVSGYTYVWVYGTATWITN